MGAASAPDSVDERRPPRGAPGGPAAARWLRQDASGIEDSLTWQLQQLLSDKPAAGASRRLVMPPVPRRVEPTEALGKLADDDHLVRVQLLVMCASNTEGRAQARLAQLQAALDVFGGRSRWAMRGWRLGPWRIGADHWPTKRGFERRWNLGHCQPPRANWVRLEELTGLLKPPTMHCRLPVLAGDLPTFEFGDSELLLQGIYRGPDGRERLVATYAEETLFEVGVGKAGRGKTERAWRRRSAGRMPGAACCSSTRTVTPGPGPPRTWRTRPSCGGSPSSTSTAWAPTRG